MTGPASASAHAIHAHPGRDQTAPLRRAARLDNKLLPLDSAARNRPPNAKHLGLATLIDTHNLVACTVSPRATG